MHLYRRSGWPLPAVAVLGGASSSMHVSTIAIVVLGSQSLCATCTHRVLRATIIGSMRNNRLQWFMRQMTDGAAMLPTPILPLPPVPLPPVPLPPFLSRSLSLPSFPVSSLRAVIEVWR